ncbi:hypothetical protein C7T94_11120 [Pedobacter yulinensis]|uniref:Uncharacterized protein n=1 Tax=Pedobacter yulinensis TaxID=2126353 RepID=A0A2T3HL49_9SPHI|nr:hypothetical protein C7T94_11120 [Pedobacter yulinensis]
MRTITPYEASVNYFSAGSGNIAVSCCSCYSQHNKITTRAMNLAIMPDTVSLEDYIPVTGRYINDRFDMQSSWCIKTGLASKSQVGHAGFISGRQAGRHHGRFGRRHLYG